MSTSVPSKSRNSALRPSRWGAAKLTVAPYGAQRRSPRGGASALGAARRHSSGPHFLHPGDVAVDPALQELACALARDLALLLDQAFLEVDVDLGLAECRH